MTNTTVSQSPPEQPASNDAVREAAVALALAAGELNMALDGQEKYRRHRQLVVDAMQALVTQLATPPEPQPASNDAVREELSGLLRFYRMDNAKLAHFLRQHGVELLNALSPPPAGQTGVDEGLVEAEERTVEELSELLWDWRKKCGDNPLHPNHYLNAARTMLAKLNLSRSPVAEGEEG